MTAVPSHRRLPRSRPPAVIAIESIRRRLLDRLVLRPTRNPIEFEDKQRVRLDVGCWTLDCFVAPTRIDDGEIDLLALKFPGTAGRGERASTFPLQLILDESPGHPARAELWTWNPPGYGQSSGRASLATIAQAAVAFAAETLRRASPNTRVLLCGNSLGCAPALHVAASGIVPATRCGMVLRNPPPLSPVVKRVARRYPMGRLLDRVAESVCESMDIEKSAARVESPIVFLQSELDRLVPPAIQSRVHQAHRGPQRVVNLNGLDHDGLPDETHAEPIRDAITWLWETIRQTP